MSSGLRREGREGGGEGMNGSNDDLVLEINLPKSLK